MAWFKRWRLLKSKQAQGERDVANLDVNEEDAQRVLNDRAAWRKLEYINQAKHAADMRRGRPPPPFSRNVRLASYFGTGVGLYFHILEWLAIMFTCITILAVPFWVVIGRSIFTVPELVDQPERGVKVFGEDLGSDLAQTTFAAIVDSRKDPEGTMRLMLTKLGQKWYGPQDKVDFLLWVSILDIAGVVLMVLLLCLFYYLARRFQKKVDTRALDVTRFAVFAKNLPPDTSAHEVGQYFSRFGTVVDVTLVPDLTYPLEACSKLTCLEQKCGMLAAYLEQGGPLIQSLKGKLLDSTHEELLVKLNKINGKLDSDKEAQDKQVRRKRKAEEKKIKKTADPMAKIEGPSHNSHCGPVYPVKAALVTFNKRRDQEVCLMLNINAGWSGFLRNIFRVSPTKKIRGYTVRVGRAAHPDDYVYENMAVFWSRPFRFLLTQFVIFILLVACALCVTGMTNWKHFLISEEKWDLGKIEADKAFGLQQADPSSTSCAAVLDSCRSYFVENLEEGRRVNSLVLGDEELLKFTDSRDQQVYRSTVTSTWSRWVQEYESVQSIPDLDQKHLEAGVPACKPCYCDGLIELENSEAFIRGDDQDAFLTASEDCSIYSGDRGVQGGIATFVAVVVLGINLLLKFVVAVLTDRQKHSTFTSRDRYFALVAYGSQLLNTVLVLLITNARAASQTKNTFQEETARWLQYILLDGQNDDFGPRWYHQAGYSFMIVLFLHTLLPLIALVAGTFWQGLKRLYVRMKFWPTQADFDVAYDYPLLKLPERVADIMLSVSITLLFCSGMPLTAATLVVILIISMVVDRLNIYRFMNVVRYSPELPRLILDILPWFLFLHCALGLWMHTYFTIDLPDHKSRSVLLNSRLDLSRFDIADVRLDFGETLQGTNIVSRLGQPNGFGLFLCVILTFLWLVIKIFFVDLIARPLYKRMKRKEKLQGLCDDKMAGGRLPFGMQWMEKDALREDSLSDIGKQPEPEGETFLGLLQNGQLEGAPTYHIPHVPRYFEPFSGLLYRAVWSKMMGPERFTRLVYNPVTNMLQISPQLLTSAEQINRKEHEPLKNAVHQKLGYVIASKWEEMLFPPACLLDDSFSEGAASPEGA